MKHKFINNAFLLTIILFSLQSCTVSNEDKLDEISNPNNEIIYENYISQSIVSSNIYDNHFYLIEKLGDNSEKIDILETVSNDGVDLNTLDKKLIKKFYFNNSDILMYSRGIKNSENKIIIYKFEKILQVALMEISPKDSFKNFYLKTLDDNLFYSLQINADDKIGNAAIEPNNIMNDFSQEVFNLETKYITNSNETNIKGDLCCRKYSGWSDCMDCSAATCGQSWTCTAALAVVGPEMIAGFAVSCIGAGSNASC